MARVACVGAPCGIFAALAFVASLLRLGAVQSWSCPVPLVDLADRAAWSHCLEDVRAAHVVHPQELAEAVAAAAVGTNNPVLMAALKLAAVASVARWRAVARYVTLPLVRMESSGRWRGVVQDGLVTR